ncbi:lipoate--protein ligase family protein [Vibrio penaeicida]|uniref:Lipoate--protein ligase A n=1 Tax=Vibrio penaeicida TaxID=104609 RepID=A0AAV5NWL2_9VIBR|nr:lipoate--protein ligase [Vibrio penaeicida]RTZ23682.1 lipoate--protein ligase [Vibrio penaeicida]GLQ75041.1 lipoate--protein ligase A [Vibrio penaeicida]
MVSKNKLVRFKSIEVEDIFEKESVLLKQVQSGELSQVLMLWQAKTATLVLPSGKKWKVTEELTSGLDNLGWLLMSRKTGGAPVPQVPGIINLSHIYHWEEGVPYDIQKSYQDLCFVLTQFFKALGVRTDIHATPHSYCDGDYNLNINGKKVVGTAQRVLLKKDGGRVVLSQACILVDAIMESIVAPVNLCNTLCGHSNHIEASVHTSLFEHIKERPSIDALYQQLTEAFLTHA